CPTHTPFSTSAQIAQPTEQKGQIVFTRFIWPEGFSAALALMRAPAVMPATPPITVSPEARRKRRRERPASAAAGASTISANACLETGACARFRSMEGSLQSATPRVGRRLEAAAFIEGANVRSLLVVWLMRLIAYRSHRWRSVPVGTLTCGQHPCGCRGRDKDGAAIYVAIYTAIRYSRVARVFLIGVIGGHGMSTPPPVTPTRAANQSPPC